MMEAKREKKKRRHISLSFCLTALSISVCRIRFEIGSTRSKIKMKKRTMYCGHWRCERHLCIDPPSPKFKTNFFFSSTCKKAKPLSVCVATQYSSFCFDFFCPLKSHIERYISHPFINKLKKKQRAEFISFREYIIIRRGCRVNGIGLLRVFVSVWPNVQAFSEVSVNGRSLAVQILPPSPPPTKPIFDSWKHETISTIIFFANEYIALIYCRCARHRQYAVK